MVPYGSSDLFWAMAGITPWNLISPSSVCHLKEMAGCNMAGPKVTVCLIVPRTTTITNSKLSCVLVEGDVYAVQITYTKLILLPGDCAREKAFRHCSLARHFGFIQQVS